MRDFDATELAWNNGYAQALEDVLNNIEGDKEAFKQLANSLLAKHEFSRRTLE